MGGHGDDVHGYDLVGQDGDVQGYDVVGHVDDEDEVASTVADTPQTHQTQASPYVVRINDADYEPWTAFKA